jgi:hypothetical protein
MQQLKNKIFKYKHINIIAHVLVWCIVLFFPYVISSAGEHYRIGPFPGFYYTLSGIIHFGIFYSNAYFLYSKFLNKAHWPLYIACVVLLIAFSYWIKLYILESVFPYVEKDARVHILFPSVVTFILSLFYAITVDKIRTDKLHKENETMRLGMELKFLRSQISPHFIFNVLTNLVYLARKKSDNLESSLLMLSGLMRYMLYDTDKKISVEQEVEYLESYVTLQKLRFGSDVRIECNFELPQEEKDRSIEPMLLIPFVENAFKHGTGYVNDPSIAINLTVNIGVLDLQVKNKYDHEMDISKDTTSGIGLANVQSRLKLLYPEKHNLMMDTSRNLFSINLTLNLM